MKKNVDGNAVVYCEGAFGTPNGKTAHGLVRRSKRYRILSVVDSKHGGADSGFVLDGKENRIPIFKNVSEAIEASGNTPHPASHLVVGLAPDGGRLPQSARKDVLSALEQGLHVDSGLHDFLSEDQEMLSAAQKYGCRIRDVRKPPHRKDLHFFSGKIEDVRPEVIILEGQGSLMNPAYPGGFEILAAGRPDVVVLQHAPGRSDYDGFPGYPIHPLAKQIQAIELLSEKPVVAVTLNHEGLLSESIPQWCRKIHQETGVPAFDVLQNGAEELVQILKPLINK